MLEIVASSLSVQGDPGELEEMIDGTRLVMQHGRDVPDVVEEEIDFLLEDGNCSPQGTLTWALSAESRGVSRTCLEGMELDFFLGVVGIVADAHKEKDLVSVVQVILLV